MANATVGINFIIKDGPDGFKRLAMDADSLRSVMQETLKITESFHSKAINFASLATGCKNVAESFSQLKDTLNTLTQDYRTFDDSMKAANTMAGKGAEDFGKLKEEVAALSGEIPMARDLLAKGLYQTISNGVPEDNWIEFLRTSARSAVGGIADLERVVGVTSTVIKNYGLSWEEAGAIQDKIQLTAKNGVTSFEQLAAALPRVTGNAATLGVSIDELMASFATLTGVSGNTAEVSTQIAAIFSALVKPSSEATKMATEMGIQFDAAAIKAAGGFEAFLKSLDESVKAYSATSGILEQEVYGKLFGSAESLRALVPLQGELASKFSENVANMVGSAGTMDAAFRDMASTGEASGQLLKNRFAELTDKVASLLATITPIANFSASVLTSAMSVTVLAQGLAKLHLWQKTVARSQKALTAVTLLYHRTAVGLTAVNRLLSASLKGVAVGATTAGVAMRTLLIASGVGAAIVGLTAVLVHFSRRSREAAGAIEELDTATEEYVRAGADAKREITSDAKALDELIRSGKDCSGMVRDLNDRYGELFGTHEKESEWMDILTRKSQAYVKAKAYEAQVISLRQKVAEQAMRKELAAEKMARLEKEGKDTETTSRPVVTGRTVRARAVTVETEEYSRLRKDFEEAEKSERSLQSELDIVERKSREATSAITSGTAQVEKRVKATAMSYDQVKSALERNTDARKKLTGAETDYKSRLKNLLEEKRQLEARKKVLEKTHDLETKQHKGSEKRRIVANPTTKDQLQTNVELTRKKLTGADTEEQHALLRNIRLWEDQLEAIKMTEAAYSRPQTLDTLERIDEELQYQRTLRQKSSKEFLAGTDAEIERLENLRRAMEDQAFVPVPVDEIKTYEQLEKQLSHYNGMVQRTSGKEREAAQEMVNSLEDVRKAWDTLLADLKAPADISLLDTSEKLDEALSYYRTRQERASADERKDIQQVINALEKKQAVLNRGVDLANLERDVAEIQKLTGEEYRIRVKALDVTALTAQLRDLRKMLDDKEDPVTDEQRKSIEGLISAYSRLRRDAFDTGGALRSAWGDVKDIGGGVRSITDALGENASAWERLTGLVDGFLQLFDGISNIVSLVNQFTVATQAHTVAKQAETVATEADTIATEVNLGVTEADTLAAEGNTVAKSGEAVANATASGAKLPFPANIAAIAAGLAAVLGGLAMVGKFASGGIVGGNSPTGDRLLARVNSGEMILNMTQQRRLFDMLNGAATIRGVAIPEQVRVNPSLPDMSGRFHVPGTGLDGAKVRFRIAGRDLVGVLANETRISSKSGKHTNIEI